MQITKVELVGSGFKGMNVTYIKEDPKGGINKMKEVTERPRHPIQLNLEIPFKDLRYYLLNICDILGEDLDKFAKDSLMNDCEVTAVELIGGCIVIKGTKSVFGEKAFKLTTPKVEEEDGYFHYDTLKSIVEKLVEETKLYLAGSVVVDNTEVVARWIGAGKSKEFDIESFNALSAEDREKFCTQVLENDFGKAVLGMSDFSVNEEEEEDVAIEGEEIVIEAKGEEILIPASK